MDMKDEFLYSPKKRILAFLLLAIFVFTAILGRFCYVQIFWGKELTAKAKDQWMRDLPLMAERGEIRDAEGVVLAASATVYTVYVRPNAVTDPEEVAELLSEKLGADKAKLLEKITKRGVSEITVAKNVEKEKTVSIKEAGLSGIYFSESVKRYYPYGSFMTQLLGFCNVDVVGQSGLESYYEDYLKGIDGEVLTETDLVGREIDGSEEKYIPSVRGLNLQTTLDFKVQMIVEGALEKAMAATKAKNASCLVMDADTGAVLAMSSKPDFDLNAVPRDDIRTLFANSKNLLVSTVYEPGSTFKILTSAIALEKNVFPEGKRFYCAGSRIVDGKKIRCWKSRGHGSQTFAEGVKNSCNCVFMDSALQIGTDTFYEYLERFGLKKKTGIDVVGETSGLFLPQKSVKSVDLARIGFGQAVAVTPVGLAAAVAAAINGGTSVTPYILQSVSDGEGTEAYRHKEKTGERIIGKETSDKLKSMLYLVVSEGGGKGAYVSGYDIGGKTGTAQKYENGKIASGKYISSFIGFSKAGGRNLLVLFMVDEPVGPYYGSIVAAPYVGEIFRGIFARYGEEPSYDETDRKLLTKTFVMPDVTGLSISEAERKMRKLGVFFETDGDGQTVTEQIPAAGATCNGKTVALLVTN